ncbi:protein CURVATURE THYLAKOID 1D, chloroplastic-like isoform X2 [Zingiber officinale]|uniref:protein CURVATURE THYLAKOID 1D, chloroplastic-like isoform X2 n=1 Tax=Zingiber officinale TaxID=94328 RepID=UPI001C4AE78A|nr:protein CURVATURE THYLAKOID 1D, chloroplastic-like isoform X2 [Zingiber officinale]
MELSSPPRSLLSLRHLHRPLAVAAPSPVLLLHSPCLFSTELLLSSRSLEPKSGFRNSGACPLRANVSDEVTSTSDLVDDDTTKKAEGPSLHMNWNSGWKDNLDGSEGVNESADSPLSKLNIKKDAEQSYPILFLGVGSLVALWISSTVISTLDSVPVVPKVLEVIGLSFTIWFTSRYLIFKENRDEFFSNLQDTKDKILGPSDE